MRIAIVITLLFTSCVHDVSRKITSDRLIGTYGNGDGFWPRSLELKKDGTFSYTQMTDVLTSVGDDKFVCEGGWAFSGHWMFMPPDKVELTTDGKPEKITVFARSSRKHDIAILEPDLFHDILRTWRDDDGLRYLKKERPNQAPEPTTTLVTPRADARVAPSAAVAHL